MKGAEMRREEMTIKRHKYKHKAMYDTLMRARRTGRIESYNQYWYYCG